MTPFFSSNFSNLFVIFICENENAEFPNFIWSNGWSILICKIPQFLTQSYRLRQLITLFQKVDTLRLPAIYIMFVLQSGSNILFLWSNSWTIDFIHKTTLSLCTDLFVTSITNSIKSGKMETESKSASQHSETFFFENIKSISVKEVNLSTKGHRHILKVQSKMRNY